MKIAIVGSGSIGLYYGAKLALAGNDVHFLMRSGRDEADRSGIHIRSDVEGDHHLTAVQHHSTTASIGPCDLVIVALKSTQNASIPGHIPPLLAPATMLLTLQNGLGNEELLASHFGDERVLGGLCYICLTRDSAASVRHVGQGLLSLGEFTGPPQQRTEQVADTLRAAGVETDLVPNLITERWRKLVWNIPFNGLAVAEGGITVDRILADAVLNRKCQALMHETIAVATALGHAIPSDFADFQIERTFGLGAYQPSTLVDYLAGRELEIAAIWGEPLRQARGTNVAVPELTDLHDRLVAIEASRGR